MSARASAMSHPRGHEDAGARVDVDGPVRHVCVRVRDAFRHRARAHVDDFP